MEAANLGAVHLIKKDGIRSIGIGVRGLQEDKNVYVQEYFELDYFFARKWLLTQHSDAFIVFPGGFGTLDEFAGVLTLMQTHNLRQVPVILIGIDFWSPFLEWIQDHLLPLGLLTQEDIYLFTITDDLEQAYCVARDHCNIGLGTIKKSQKK
jgi:uncharacterized protein (TIGR00730 family)